MSDSPADDEPLVTRLEGDEARRMLEDLSTEPKYDQLKDEVLRRGEALRPEDVIVVRVDGEQHGVIADVPLADTDADEGHLAIGQNVETGEITLAALEYENERDGKTEETTLELTNSSSFEETTRVFDPDTLNDIEFDVPDDFENES
ncbi:hypothetical protein [Halorussus amylolyticus]|uniref:hypothetical protein n=1 Tax=Halorussus amylolyticus TaxID=1126242 RepID=UPI0010485937|nr:hypothetical protein [Halorussus amylolyticus]